MKFTDEQLKVIDSRGQNLLVSAAAGSGKTAVLTQRIIKKVCDDPKEVPIDRILIATFTEAAAEEMKIRIGRELRKRLSEDPSNARIRKQLGLIYNARITTIDGFCKYLIDNHFQEIGVDPSYRIADETESKLLKTDALDETFKELFDSEDEDFLFLLETYAPNGKMKIIRDCVFEFADFTESLPFPEKWIEEEAENIKNYTAADFENSSLVKFVINYEDALLKECIDKLDEAISLSSSEGGPIKYKDVLMSDYGKVSNLKQASFTQKYDLYNTFSFDRLPGGKNTDFDQEVLERVKGLRDAVKEIIKELKDKIFFAPADVLAEREISSGKTKLAFISVTKKYMENFKIFKKEQNLIDFSDMEHLAIKLLLKEENGELVPTDTAYFYRDYYEEIMVDEYQDTNSVQETILSVLSKQTEDFGNRFMVGDIKQSIYGFRLAKPDIFIEKYKNYSMDEGRDLRIDLSKNFRSRREVVDAVNRIFESIMSEDVGNIEYDDAAHLYVGADYPEVETDNTCEVLALTDSEEVKLNSAESTVLEAAVIAAKIKELYNNAEVYDKDKECVRKATYSDMVILLRTASGVDGIYREELEKCGIPAYVVAKTGYFKAKEVVTMLNLLKIIDNPRQDLPLMGVLHSEIGSFTESEIAKIRALGGKKLLLYGNLLIYAQDGTDAKCRFKCKQFLDELEMWRQKSEYLRVYELIDEILDYYHYVEIQAALPGGEQRRANLRILSERARIYENTGYSGLFNFTRYIMKMQDREADYGEAGILDDNSDVVRIMTVHKSKGLEFPICFVAGTGRRLGNSFQDEGSLDCDEEMGIAVRAFDEKNSVLYETLKKSCFSAKNGITERGEDLRILYVALTRAREKLFIVGKYKDSKRNQTNMNSYAGKLTLHEKLKATSFLDMIMPVAIRNEKVFDVIIYEPELVEGISALMHSEVAKSIVSLDKIKPNHNWKPYSYPHKYYENLYFKTSVSELKHKAIAENFEGVYEPFETEKRTAFVPDFIKSEIKEPGGAKRGSAYHRILELIDYPEFDFTNAKEELISSINQMVEAGYIKREDADMVSVGKIVKFLGSKTAERMANAGKKDMLYREQPFVLRLSAKEVDEEFPEEEGVLIQGIIDVYFEEDGELVLLDYKTDFVTSSDELVNKYKTQLEYYKRACEELEGKKVKEVLIYSFALGETITV